MKNLLIVFILFPILAFSQTKTISGTVNDENNLPIGLQIITNSFEEQKLLNIAKNIQDTINYNHKPNKWWTND